MDLRDCIPRELAFISAFFLSIFGNTSSLPGNWTKLPSNSLLGAGIAQIDAGISRYVWALDYSGKPHVQTGLKGQWTEVNSLEDLELSWVSSGAAGVWGLQKKIGVPLFRDGVSPLLPVGKEWVPVSGRGFKIIESGLRGCVYALTRKGELYYRDGITESNRFGTSWRQIWGTYRFISAGSYGVWAIDFYDRIYFGKGSSAHLSLIKNWSQVDALPGKEIKSVVTGFDGSVWTLTSNGEVFKRENVNIVKPTGNTGWKRINGLKLREITAGLPGVVGITDTNDLVVHKGI